MVSLFNKCGCSSIINARGFAISETSKCFARENKAERGLQIRPSRTQKFMDAKHPKSVGK